MDIETVVAREQIRDLTTRYNSYSDTGRFDPLWDLFAADAVMELHNTPGGEADVYEGRERIKEIFLGAKGRMTGSDAAPSAGSYIRHFTATHQIDLVDADHAQGRLYFSVLMDHGLDHWGRYIDRYVRGDERWQFEHRRVYVDGRSSQSTFTR